MPLPRRSKRIKNAQDSQELSLSNHNSTPNSNSAEAVTTKGLPILPDELYLEIISYYPVTPIPQDTWARDPDIDVENQNVRHQVLFALSQTSLNLRRFFLRYTWQRIEVCRTENMRSRTLALELVRQLEIVTIREPTLAKYVEIVDVEIGPYSRHSILTELARCLALFPNLHTVRLKVEHDASMKYDAVGKSFKGYIYPNIRTAIVSNNATGFLMTCPESRLGKLLLSLRDSNDLKS